MLMTLSIEISVSASHQLEGDIHSEKCKRGHGHNYDLEITLSSRVLDKNGMMVDVGWVKHEIDSAFDHSCLNDSTYFKAGVAQLDGPLNTTAENFAQVLASLIQYKLDVAFNAGVKPENQVVVESVSVKETDHMLVILYTGIREQRESAEDK